MELTGTRVIFKRSYFMLIFSPSLDHEYFDLNRLLCLLLYTCLLLMRRLHLFNSQAPELYRGPRARCARSGENGEGESKSL